MWAITYQNNHIYFVVKSETTFINNGYYLSAVGNIVHIFVILQSIYNKIIIGNCPSDYLLDILCTEFTPYEMLDNHYIRPIGTLSV